MSWGSVGGMADETNETTAGLIAHLQKIAPDNPCPLCKNMKWRVHTVAVVLLESATTAPDGRPAITQAPHGALGLGSASCTVCGYTFFLDLSTAKVWPRE